MTSTNRSYRSELATLTGAKVVANTALRWISPFLPTLERAWGTTTGTLTGVMGAAEMAGLSTVPVGRYLDRGHERRVMVLGLIAIGVGSLVALAGTVSAFAAGFVALIVGVTNLTAAGHTWIGRRVPFAARSRAIGLYEVSWALALLVGAPTMALLIEWFGWRGPFAFLGIACFVSAAVVQVRVSAGTTTPRSERREGRLPATAWFPMLASASTAAAGIGTFVIAGAWLDDDFGVSTGGLGLIAAGLGLVELAASSSVAFSGDRVGPRRAVLGGLVVLLIGLGVMAAADGEGVAVLGLLVLFAGFEYAFVSSLTLVTEAAPDARGRAIGISNACGTIARASAIALAGQLYERFGITGPIVMATVTTVVGGAFTLATRVD